jgi:hypothetical protein
MLESVIEIVENLKKEWIRGDFASTQRATD